MDTPTDIPAFDRSGVLLFGDDRQQERYLALAERYFPSLLDRGWQLGKEGGPTVENRYRVPPSQVVQSTGGSGRFHLLPRMRPLHPWLT